MTHRLLCVDPDENARTETVERLRSGLDGLDLTFVSCASLAEAEDALSPAIAAIVTEYDIDGGTGVELITRADEVCPDAGCVLYTGTDPDAINTAALGDALTEYVGKTSLFGDDRLTQLVRTIVEERRGASYPVPQMEAERINALHSYDLDNEELHDALDRLTDLAAAHFDVAIASINIIDEHSQEFLACHGSATEWESMDREASICTFTILEDDDVMIVEDVTEDPRFESRSEALIGMGIRSYMGASLIAPSGLRIGSLCVYDDEPRSFGPGGKEYLSDLAATAMELIELHTRLDATEATMEGKR
jgi:GAF domain-containing protein